MYAPITGEYCAALAKLQKTAYTGGMQYELHFVDSIDSTNTALKSLAASGAPEGTVLCANQQTAGRGRLGRSFYSPTGSGLYVSLLLRPRFALPPASLTCLAAVALAETVQGCGVDCTIKWVNDLYVGAKKAAGVLTEGALRPDGTLLYAVVGVGVNLSTPPDLPSDLRPIVTGLFRKPLSKEERDAFLHQLLDRFAFYYDRLPAVAFWEPYNRLQNVFGRTVSFSENGIAQRGTAEAIDRDFRLIVRTEHGTTALERGEVTFVQE